MKLVCPMCKTEVEEAEDFKWRPFCSARCKGADLHNWLTGEYRISTSFDPGETEDEIKLS